MKTHLQRYDLILLGVTLLLCAAGVIMVGSASFSLSERIYGDSFYFLKRHLMHLALGLLMLLIIAHSNPDTWTMLIPWGMIIGLGLLIMVLMPGIGHEVGGARRWFQVGVFSFQPTEALKLVLVAHTAYYMARKQSNLYSFINGILPGILVIALYLFLIVNQPDFGSVVLISLVLLMMVFVGGGKIIHVLLSLMGMVGIGAFAIMTHSYRLNRIMAFLDPWSQRMDAGFQIVQSYLAIGSGGWFGMGQGRSHQKLFFLPEAHTDFIFSIIGEEYGLLGSVVIILLWGVFLWRGYRIVLRTGGIFLRLLGFGMVTMLGLQAIINLAVTMGLLPTKGLPLPFISYGGSSLLVSLCMIGAILRIGRTGD